MSRKGNCLDHEMIENFFGILKSELFYIKKYASVDELKTDIKTYIKYYNNSRIKPKLNVKSPVQYRTLAAFFIKGNFVQSFGVISITGLFP